MNKQHRHHQHAGTNKSEDHEIAACLDPVVCALENPIADDSAERISHHTGQTVERIEADSDRDRWFTAEEAKDYGFIDHVITRAAQAAAGAGTRQ